MSKAASLRKRALEGLAQLALALAVLIFLPAGSVAFWQGWVFLLVFMGGCGVVTAYFLKRDPALIERRLKAGPGAETRPLQRRLQVLASVLFFALIALPGIDRQLGWSHLSPSWVLFGDVLIVVGFGVIFAVFRTNSFTSGTIEIGEGQQTIATGPYRLVRHPMYSGALIMMAGIPLALGSAWGLAILIPMTGVIVLRLLDEEEFLAATLVGYAAYRMRTRYRLLPGLY